MYVILIEKKIPVNIYEHFCWKQFSNTHLRDSLVSISSQNINRVIDLMRKTALHNYNKIILMSIQYIDNNVCKTNKLILIYIEVYM